MCNISILLIEAETMIVFSYEFSEGSHSQLNLKRLETEPGFLLYMNATTSHRPPSHLTPIPPLNKASSIIVITLTTPILIHRR